MNLRQAAEALLNHWEAGEYKNCTGDMAGHIRVLREAAAQPEWVEELRGNTPDCKTHPDAPHGFDRNASHSADRYVCECEGWEPPRRQWVGLTDEEVKYLTSHFDWRAPKEQFVPVIEAKLKEKNSGN